MSQDFVISLLNRYSGQIEQEKVYGEGAIKFAYNSAFSPLMASIISSKTVTSFYGKLQDRDASRKKVPPFIQNFDIQIDDYEPGSIEGQPIEHSYKNFNEFFIRKFKPGKRPFPSEADSMGAFAEARYFGYDEITPELTIPVKGKYLSASQLLGNAKNAAEFEGGPLLLARLCPVDYHRYHYSDAGKTLENYRIHGKFDSVNPLALKYKQDIFIKNERRISIVESKNFGKMAYVEVGATCVGKIVQSADEKQPHTRGQEKGYFLFGGSTVIVLGQKGRWVPSQDILDNTQKHLETYVHLGDEVARARN